MNRHGLLGLGVFGCDVRNGGATVRVHGLEHGDFSVLEHKLLVSGDVVVLVRWPGRATWSCVGHREYRPTTYSIWRLEPVGGAWSFDRPLRSLPRTTRPDFSGWYRIVETLRREEPGRRRSVVRELRDEVAAMH